METLSIILSTVATVCICTPSLLKGKNMRLILLLVFSSNFLLGISYLLSGAYNGFASACVGCTQTIINYFFDRKGKNIPVWLVIVYALSLIAVNLLTFTKAVDLIAMVASLTFVMCIGQKTGAKYRIWVLINTVLWSTYDVFGAAWGPLLTHGIQVLITIGGIIIHDLKKPKSDTAT